MALTKEDLKSIGSLMDEKISELARITANGFDDVNHKFEQIDKRFEQIDKKIEGETSSLRSEMRTGFGKINENIDLLNKKIDKTDDRTMKDQNVMAGDIVRLDKRISKLEKLKIA